MGILLDYVFKVDAITPTPAASTSFLKKVLAVVKPKGGVTPGTIETCVSQAEIGALTDNTDAVELLNAGMSSIFVLPVAGLDDVAAAIANNLNDFYTILISSDFDREDIIGTGEPLAGGMDLGLFSGVVGISTDDTDDAAEYAAIENRCGFYSLAANKAENMFYSFGKLLSNASNWNNQQYVTLPVDDEIEALGDAEALFDDKISFAITDAQYGTRLSLFACGGKAIVEPYIVKNLELDMQSDALNYISGNQPQYTKREAALLENSLKDVIQLYVDRLWIEQGTVEVTLEEANFVASADIDISEPKALWRVFAELRQTL